MTYAARVHHIHFFPFFFFYFSMFPFQLVDNAPAIYLIQQLSALKTQASLLSSKIEDNEVTINNILLAKDEKRNTELTERMTLVKGMEENRVRIIKRIEYLDAKYGMAISSRAMASSVAEQLSPLLTVTLNECKTMEELPVQVKRKKDPEEPVLFDNAQLKRAKKGFLEFPVNAECKSETFPITLKYLSGKLLELNVDESMSIADVKLMAQSLLGVSLVAHCLMHNGIKLEDCSTLAECKIGKDFVIVLKGDMSSSSPCIWIKTLDGKKILFEVISSESVASLKTKIQAKEGIPVEQQLLIFGGSKMEDIRTLSSYKVELGSTVYLELRFSLFIRTPRGKLIKMEFFSRDVVKDVKNRIKKNVSVNIMQQNLLFQGVMLRDYRTLAEESIGVGAILDLQIVGYK